MLAHFFSLHIAHHLLGQNVRSLPDRSHPLTEAMVKRSVLFTSLASGHDVMPDWYK